jgi:phosphoenolpyruvate-protein kinase (PTS system EI component)
MKVDSAYLRERASDLGEIRRRFLDVLCEMSQAFKCASEPRYTPHLLELGIRTFSVSARHIPNVRRAVRRHRHAGGRPPVLIARFPHPRVCAAGLRTHRAKSKRNPL